MATTKAKTAKKAGSKKTSAKSKAASNKAKTTAKSVAAKTTKKEKATVATSNATIKAELAGAEEVAAKTTIIASEKANPAKNFFARKGDKNENILTIFKDSRIVGALIAEIIGTALVSGIALTLGLFNPLYFVIAYVGILAVTYKLSGAHLNPIVTAGMMATRRISAIRGILYFIAQIIGAWIAYLVINYCFYSVGIASGNIDATAVQLPALTPASEIDTQVTEGFGGFFWAITSIELIGAMIIGFFYARALNHKRGVYTFAALAGTGMFTALMFAVLVTSNFLGISDTVFVLNPATSVMYGLFPSAAEGFDGLMSQLMPMIATYVIFPVIGGIVGFYVSDIAAVLAKQELAN